MTLAAPAFVRAADTATPSASLARGCSEKSARPAEAPDVAANPAEFAGKCVRLEGWWRDIGFYPTRAEAAQPDALSIVILDQRRLGLYLKPTDAAAAPSSPRLVTIVGRVGGACAAVPPDVRFRDEGYCHYKPGPWLAVSSIKPK